jgi:hypothetical protein
MIYRVAVRLASDGPSGKGESHQRSGRDRHGLP